MALVLTSLFTLTSCGIVRRTDYFQISMVDASTGRGVPLVELAALNAVRYYTDSNGVIAFWEPDLMGREVYFEVHSHGYQSPKLSDGKTDGVLLNVQRGGKAVIRIRRINVAERLYRVTGEGIYRDSVLLGLPVPVREPLLNAQVMGTDGASTAVYHGKLFWFFGDTNGVNYNLNLAGAAATSDLPGKGGLDPSKGVDLNFFVDDKGFAKPMFPYAEGEELVWPDGPMALPDPSGVERLVMRYDRGAGLGRPKPAERGLAVFRDDRQVFEKIVRWDVNAPLHPEHTPFRVRVKGQEYFYFAGGGPAPDVRVRALWSDVIDLAAYEGFTPVRQGSRTPELARDAHGRLEYAWKRNTPVLTDRQRDDLIAAGKMKPEEAHLAAVDIETGARVALRSASVQWNGFRRRWVMIAQQTEGKTSKLGEVWYLETDTPLGPWAFARKIMTHDRYSFYEIIQHPQFDQQGGRLIYFTGTYSDFFANPPNITPRYDYNLIMYRLDLGDSRLHMPAAVYKVSPGVLMTGEQVQRENAWDRVTGIEHFASGGRVWKSPSDVLIFEPDAQPVQ